MLSLGQWKELQELDGCIRKVFSTDFGCIVPAIKVTASKNS
jgi:hypothetical protein